MKRSVFLLTAAYFILWFGSVQGQPTSEELLEKTRTYPEQPADAADLVKFTNDLSFASGTPFNDILYTILSTTYMEGETAGYDYFFPADPSDAFPGDQVMLVSMVNNLDLAEAYHGQQGDRVILGTNEVDRPFFLAGEDEVDNEWAVIQHFDYNNGHIQLRGTADDYRLLYATEAEGVATEGYYLFYTANGEPDLVAFIYPCDFVVPPISGNPPRDPNFMCNDSQRLSLTDPVQFQYAQPINTTPALRNAVPQVGTSANDLIHGSVTDQAGNVYLYGSSHGNFTGPVIDRNEFLVIKLDSAGNQLWAAEVAGSDGALLFDAVVDSRYLYAAGRTHGAIPGFTSGGQWDAVILKINLATGEVVDSDQWGNRKIDGYGNITLDDAGNLYLSGAGSPADAEGTDPDHLLAKHRAETLENVWRVFDAPEASPAFVSEAWGGITYIPGDAPGNGQVVIGGWYMSIGGANSFVSVYNNLDADAPARQYTTTLTSPGTEADWVLDNVVDSQGNIYVAGYTTGSLEGGQQRGNGDFFVVKYTNTLENPRVVQWGTPQSDGLRKLVIDEQDKLYAVGYTYGDYQGDNANPQHTTGDIVVQKLDTDLTLLAARQLGTEKEERGFVHYANGVIYLAGITEGTLSGVSHGSMDGFVAYLDSQELLVLSPEELPRSLVLSSNSETIMKENEPVFYPNPAQDRLYYSGDIDRFEKIELFDSLGKGYRIKPVGKVIGLPANWPAGLYYVVAYPASGLPVRTKVLKQ